MHLEAPARPPWPATPFFSTPAAHAASESSPAFGAGETGALKCRNSCVHARIHRTTAARAPVVLHDRIAMRWPAPASVARTARTSLSSRLNALSSCRLRSAKTPGGLPCGRRLHAATLRRMALHPVCCCAAVLAGDGANAPQLATCPGEGDGRVRPPAAATPSASTKQTGRMRRIARREPTRATSTPHLPRCRRLRSLARPSRRSPNGTHPQNKIKTKKHSGKNRDRGLQTSFRVSCLRSTGSRDPSRRKILPPFGHGGQRPQLIYFSLFP